MIIDLVCNNNGILMDLSDDMYSFELIVIVVNMLVVEFIVIVNGIMYIELFGMLIIIGILVDEDVIIINILVVGEDDCLVEDIMVLVIGECFDDCLIEVVVVDLVCDFNGIIDLGDDMYSFELMVIFVNEIG